MATGIGAFTVPQGLAALGIVLATAARQPCAAGSTGTTFTAGRISWTKLLGASRQLQTSGRAAPFLAEFMLAQGEPVQPSAVHSPEQTGSAVVQHGLAMNASGRLAQLESVVRQAAQALVGRPVGADEPLLAAGQQNATHTRVPCDTACSSSSSLTCRKLAGCVHVTGLLLLRMHASRR